MSAGEFIAAVQSERQRRLRTRVGGPRMATSWRASEIGHPCDRSLFFGRHPDHYTHQAPIDDGLASIFEEGDLHEADIVSKLVAWRFKVMGQQQEYRDPDPEVDITGHIDLLVEWEPEPGKPQRYVVDVKSMHPNSFAMLRTLDDLREGPVYARKYPAQIMVYCYGFGLETGLMLGKNKATGEWHFIEVPCDRAYVETLRERARRLTGNLRSGVIPEPVDDRSICARCKWLAWCAPPSLNSEGLTILSDEIGDLLDQASAIEEQGRRWAKAMDAAKEKAKAALPKGGCAVSGEWIIEASISDQNRAAQPEKTLSVFRPKFKRSSTMTAEIMQSIAALGGGLGGDA